MTSGPKYRVLMEEMREPTGNRVTLAQGYCTSHSNNGYIHARGTYEQACLFTESEAVAFIITACRHGYACKAEPSITRVY